MRILWTLKIGILILATLVSSRGWASDSFELRVDTKSHSFSQQEKDALNRFLDAIQNVLPPKLKASFHKPIVIQFKKIGTTGFGKPPCEGETVDAAHNYHYGLDQRPLPFQSAYDIQINEGFIGEIVKGPDAATTYACGHHNLYRLAMATVIHEIAHHYDWMNLDMSAEAREMRSSCSLVVNNPELQSSDDWKRCQKFLQSGTTVSGRPDYLSLMGFTGTPKHDNRRSPDPYEFKDSAESFAVNFEFFTLDHDFACRRPNVSRFFSGIFGFTPASSCQTNNTVIVTGYTPDTWRVAKLDPSRIYEIHYLLADSGDEAMSRFGHAMYRIVLCAPDRKVVGPDCLKDVSSHLVVSYRANVRGITLNQIKGLTGDYPSQLFLLRFLDVKGEYTLSESRTLLSYPIKLDRDQLGALVSQINEEYWQYQNRYYFVNNNCATESMNLFRAALPETPWSYADPALTPKGLRSLFVQQGLIDPNVISAANAEGRYRFSSITEGARVSFEKIVASGLTLPENAKTLELYLALKASDRQKIQSALQSSGPEKYKTVVAHFLELELLCQERAALAIQKKGSELAQAQEYAPIQDIQDELEPWTLAHGGYGVPVSSEMPDLKSLDALLNRLGILVAEQGREMQPQLQAEIAEYQGTTQNLKTLLAVLKSH